MIKPTFKRLLADAVPSSKKGIYFLNESVKQTAEGSLVGFYQYTKESEYKNNSYKCGQTEIGVLERLSQQRTASTTEKFIIVGWIPSQLALNKSEDQKILHALHVQEKCTLCNILDEDLSVKEWAVFENNNPEEVILNYLSDVENGIDKKSLGLTIWQLETLDKIFSNLNEDKQKIMAELAARFGKTLLYLSLLKVLDKQVMVVGSYYLTALTSFNNEVYRYSDFSNFKVLDLYDVNFQESFDAYLEQGNKVVVTASLCGDKTKDENVRNQNADFISKFTNKITVIDEADYGAHTESCVPFVNKIGAHAPIILTTGTNSERASNNHEIDVFIKVSYLDMQMRALSDHARIINDVVNQFSRASEFEKNLPKVKFYRFDWSRFIDVLSDKNTELNPSFSKCSIDVNKNSAFWTGMYQTLIGVSSNCDLNDYSLSNALNGKSESVIQFVNMSNAQLKHLEKIARACLGNFYDVYAICGEDVKGAYAEEYVKNKIRIAKQKGKHVWIIASQMCQRSFSVADLNTVILSYDNGDAGATNQKISRALTNGNREKTGYVISLSIDGNRDDKIMPMIYDAAKDVVEHEDVDLYTAIKKVMKTFPIFQLDEDGYPVELLPDEYAKEMFSSTNGIRVSINKERVYISDYENEAFKILSSLDVSSNTLKQLVDITKGKTYKPGEQQRQLSKTEQKVLHSIIIKNIANILDNLVSTLKYQKMIRDKMTYPELIEVLNVEHDSAGLVGVNGDQLSTIVDCGYIQKDLLQMYIESN